MSIETWWANASERSAHALSIFSLDRCQTRVVHARLLFLIFMKSNGEIDIINLKI